LGQALNPESFSFPKQTLDFEVLELGNFIYFIRLSPKELTQSA